MKCQILSSRCFTKGVSLILLLTSLNILRTAHADSSNRRSVPFSQFIYGDPLPDAPLLAPRGPYAVGVRTVQLKNPSQVDVNRATYQNPNPKYDRPVTIEVWYPAADQKGVAATYTDCLSPQPGQPPPTVYTFQGRAFRNAVPDLTGGPYPLLVVSHGYPGSRVMMSYLTENLASKGYVVAAIDHADSTHFDKGSFESTLVNRWSDITFVLDAFQSAQTPKPTKSEALSAFAGVANVNNVALIGYSMGGYGVLNVAGAGYSPRIQDLTEGRLTGRLANAPGYGADPRVKAVVAFAPWGENAGAWDPQGIAGLNVPVLFVDGDHDDVAGYENGVRRLFNLSVNSDRYLLVYENARHNIAPNPPPQLPGMNARAYLGYGEPDWDSARINNVNQHFVTAFLDSTLKGKDERSYLNLPVNPGTNDWSGFAPRTAVGLELWHLNRGQSGTSAVGAAQAH